MKTQTKPKEIYVSPETEVLKLITESIVCQSGEGHGYDDEWD